MQSAERGAGVIAALPDSFLLMSRRRARIGWNCRAGLGRFPSGDKKSQNRKGKLELKHARILFTASLFLLLLLSLTGCGFLTAMFSPVVGGWTLYADWDSTGTYSSNPIEFEWDQGFVQASYEGTWTQKGDVVTFIYDKGPTYTGTLGSSHRQMEGTMTSAVGRTGKWYAEKLVKR
jgi:hypothetical protein